MPLVFNGTETSGARRGYIDLISLDPSKRAGEKQINLVRTHLRRGIAISKPTLTLID